MHTDTTYGCPDVVSYCELLSSPTNASIVPQPLLPSLGAGEFPADMTCDYFSGGPSGSAAASADPVGVNDPVGCRPGEVKPPLGIAHHTPLVVKFKCKDQCVKSIVLGDSFSLSVPYTAIRFNA